MTSAVLGIADDIALGGSLRVIVTKPDSLRAAKVAVDQVVAAIDLAASRFREDSELSRLNASPDRCVKVSPLLAQAINAALRGARLSSGAVDPTIGSAVRLAGYNADFAQVPIDGDQIRLVAQRVPGWRAIQFNHRSRMVCLPWGVELDLGATAKALAADLAAAAASEAIGRGGVLVSLGGDIAVAGQAPPEGWPIQASEDSGAPIDGAEETVAITSGGVATSSTTVRRWTRGGALLHHIIDPETGCRRTAAGAPRAWWQPRVSTPTSTAAVVMGRTAIPWLEANRLQGRLVDLEGKVHRVAGWPEPRQANSDLLPTIL